MKSLEKSINQNGCSVCAKGEEKLYHIPPRTLPKSLFYQYDYRHKNGELFSTVAPTLEQCRSKRDKWIQKVNYKRLSPYILKLIQDNKRLLTKGEISYQIGIIKPAHIMANMVDCFPRDEIVTVFNSMFGTEIK